MLGRADAPRDRHRAARLGRAAPRPEHPAARRGPRLHRRQARRALIAKASRCRADRFPSSCRRRSSRSPPSRSIARRCCPGSISAIPDRSRRRSARRSSRPRDGYPLYFAIGQLFLWVDARRAGARAEPRVGDDAALACGLLVLVAAELSGSSRRRGWRGAALRRVVHVLEPGGHRRGLRAAHRAGRADAAACCCAGPSGRRTARLALFFAVYAVAFGNHLSMILLAPAFTLFLLLDGAGRMAIARDAASRRRSRPRAPSSARSQYRVEPARALAAAVDRSA